MAENNEELQRLMEKAGLVLPAESGANQYAWDSTNCTHAASTGGTSQAYVALHAVPILLEHATEMIQLHGALRVRITELVLERNNAVRSELRLGDTVAMLRINLVQLTEVVESMEKDLAEKRAAEKGS